MKLLDKRTTADATKLLIFILVTTIATGLLVFETLSDAMAALPGLAELGLATIELLDAASLRVAQGLTDVPQTIASIDVHGHAALLVGGEGVLLR